MERRETKVPKGYVINGSYRDGEGKQLQHTELLLSFLWQEFPPLKLEFSLQSRPARNHLSQLCLLEGDHPKQLMDC